ncbi:surfactin synthase thioesterase subunit [Paenibacillus cellulosilyticus]|uniref:Surfactin synthase thioesterase subunit n=1 Tax=Paenibacillus cellulosilyticus TaxID=375489 RepID=A0A2V2YUR8_9BACL|nr:thioesterase domain-containing protein [Paenibacillus cellulosilyticus]PWW04860.1 surfactin synthase thioesterase subunit [Paenibacillus cellulosilyticus]QKS45971.1 thioesterase [Paenibacillus cellulosilyticus]
MDLYCLPYAGASSAVYKKWEKPLGGELRIQSIELPGRGRKFGKMRLNSMEQMIEHVFEELKGRLESGEPYGLFGHSLGGMLAYRLVERIGQAGLPAPRHLFISGVLPPHATRPYMIDHTLPDIELKNELQRLGGLTSEVLDHPELLKLMLPIIRSDLQAHNDEHTFRTQAGPVPCDMTVFYGRQDPLTEGDMGGWSLYTSMNFQIEAYAGGHFFIHDEEASLTRTMVSRLK